MAKALALINEMRCQVILPWKPSAVRSMPVSLLFLSFFIKNPYLLCNAATHARKSNCERRPLLKKLAVTSSLPEQVLDSLRVHGAHPA